MQVVHTAALPPRSGSAILANIGSTRKSSAALKNIVTENAATRMVCDRRPPGSAESGGNSSSGVEPVGPSPCEMGRRANQWDRMKGSLMGRRKKPKFWTRNKTSMTASHQDKSDTITLILPNLSAAATGLRERRGRASPKDPGRRAGEFTIVFSCPCLGGPFRGGAFWSGRAAIIA